MTVLKWLVVFVSAGYLGGLAVLYVKQREYIFPIPETVRTAPGAAGLVEAEEHVLTTADRERVIVWHVAARPGHAVVIYFAGNGDILAGSVGRFRSVIADGTGLVALGTGVAVAVAAEHPIAKLILEAPYASMADVAAWHFPMVPVRWLLRDRFRSGQRIVRVAAPLLIMHGERDFTIPIRFGERLFGLAPRPKQFVRFPEGGHDNLGNYGAIETALEFINASKG